MKKILTLLAVGAFSASCLTVTSACSNSNDGATNPNLKFDVWNLSSWGDAQKNIISKCYLETAQKDNTIHERSGKPLSWGDWSDTDVFTQDTSFEEDSLFMGLDKINQDIYIGLLGDDVNWFDLPTPSYKASLKTVLSQGIELYLKGYKDGIYGHLSVAIKGSIE